MGQSGVFSPLGVLQEGDERDSHSALVLRGVPRLTSSLQPPPCHYTHRLLHLLQGHQRTQGETELLRLFIWIIICTDTIHMFACVYACALHVYLVPEEARKGL